MATIPFKLWLLSREAQTVGPLEFVRGPHLAEFILVACVILLTTIGIVVPVEFCVLESGLSQNTLAGREGSATILLVVGALLMALAIRLGINRLRPRLFVGRNGVALWRPEQTLIIRWTDLGTLWRLAAVRTWSDSTWRGGVLILERSDGEQFILNGFFADEDRVVRRILEELARQIDPVTTPVSPTLAPPENPAIILARHDIAEPES
jgi:hypothetical protein